MSSATLTRGFSISGGFQAGNTRLVTLGFGVGEEATLRAASFAVLNGADNRFTRLGGTHPGFIPTSGSDPNFGKVNG